MSTAAVTQIPAPRFSVDWTPVRDTLAALRAGHESLDLFVGQLFSGLESMRERLDQHDRRIKEERKQLAADRKRLADEQAELSTKRKHAGGAAEAGGRVAELEHERATLEDELETVRRRCEELAEALTEQKRHNAEERAEWTAEFRSLRKILDKQTQGAATHGGRNSGPAGAAAAASQPGSAAGDRAKADPVLGSVVSQFQLLQKDAARRRAQQAKNKAS